MCQAGELSCAAKLARVVLDNRGPLSPTELAREGHVDRDEAREALLELVDLGLATKVCGLCDSREEVFELTEVGREHDHARV
ncbi:MAG: hypothetical protein ABEI31_06680 [Halodesulfurarchaeum sp.]